MYWGLNWKAHEQIFKKKPLILLPVSETHELNS